MDRNKEVFLLDTKRKIKQAKEDKGLISEMDLCKIEKCFEILEYENEQLNYMVEKQLDYTWNKINENKK